MENFEGFETDGYEEPLYESDVESSDDMAISYALDHGYTVLRSNTSGARTIDRLENTSPFWVGFATQGVSVGILNAKVGIAGAHFLTATPEDIQNGITRAFGSGRNRAQQERRNIERGGYLYVMETFVPVERRAKRVVEAIETAANLYNAIDKNVSGTNQPWVGITGVCYGTKADAKFLKGVAEKALQNKLHNPSMYIDFGQPGGVTYGGPHSDIPRPEILNLQLSNY